MGSFRTATFFVILGLVQSVAVGQTPSAETLQEIFAARANALENDFTLRYSVVIPPTVKPNGESETLRYDSVLTHRDGQFSVLMRLHPDTKPPTYPKNATNTAYFERDEAGNVLLWRDLERHIQADNKIQIRRNLKARMVVPISGELGFERDVVTAAKPSSRFVAHRQDPLRFLEVHQPLIAAGIGHFLYVNKITFVSAHDEDSALLYCEGVGRSPASTSDQDHVWKMVLDPQRGYLLKSAQIVGPAGGTMLSDILNDGALHFGESVIAGSSIYTLAPEYVEQLRQQYQYAFHAFEHVSCDDAMGYVSKSINTTEDGPATFHVVEDPVSRMFRPQRLPEATDQR